MVVLGSIKIDTTSSNFCTMKKTLNFRLSGTFLPPLMAKMYVIALEELSKNQQQGQAYNDH